MPDIKSKSDLFERHDGGHCYLRIQRRRDHFEFIRMPRLVSTVDMLELLAWAAGSSVAAGMAESMPVSEVDG